MGRSTRWWIAGLVLVGGLGPAAGSRAQVPAPRYGGRGTGQGLAGLTDPRANPFLNPVLNPYFHRPGRQGDAALLYYLSGRRAAAEARGAGIDGGAGSTAAPAEMPRSMMVPGGAAARYFHRGPAPSGLGAYYSRNQRHFPHKGR
jgi:hypothetical protein